MGSDSNETNSSSTLVNHNDRMDQSTLSDQHHSDQVDHQPESDSTVDSVLGFPFTNVNLNPMTPAHNMNLFPNVLFPNPFGMMNLNGITNPVIFPFQPLPFSPFGISPFPSINVSVPEYTPIVPSFPVDNSNSNVSVSQDTPILPSFPVDNSNSNVSDSQFQMILPMFQANLPVDNPNLNVSSVPVTTIPSVCDTSLNEVVHDGEQWTARYRCEGLTGMIPDEHVIPGVGRRYRCPDCQALLYKQELSCGKHGKFSRYV